MQLSRSKIGIQEVDQMVLHATAHNEMKPQLEQNTEQSPEQLELICSALNSGVNEVTLEVPAA